MSTRFPLPDGRPPTHDDLLRLVPYNVVVNQVYRMYQVGHLNFEQALIGMVLVLVDQNETLLQQLVESAFRQRTIYIKET